VATPVLGRGGTWLREGLAQYSGIKAAGALLGAAAERDLWRSQVRGYLGRADLRRARQAAAIFGNEPTLRDATYLDEPRVAYLRGALVFRILEHVHGPEAFRTALRRWSDAHAYRFADLEDFAREIGPRDLLDYYAGTTRLPDLALGDVRAEEGRVRARLACADASWPGGRVPVRLETDAGTHDLEVEVRDGAGALQWRGAGRPRRIEVDPERLWLDPLRSNSLWE
jgi:hypothetical protein